MTHKKCLFSLGGFIICFLFVSQVYADEIPSLLDEYHRKGSITFIEAVDPNEPTGPVDPTDPEKPVEPVDPIDPDGPHPGTDGPLSIDFASSLFFGKQKIVNTEQVYYASAQEIRDNRRTPAKLFYVPHFFQITDKRRSFVGWTLSVKQEQTFTDVKDAKKQILGTEIRLRYPHTVSLQKEPEDEGNVYATNVVIKPNVTSHVMTAKEGYGGGTWQAVYGTGAYEKTANQSENQPANQLAKETIDENQTVGYEGVTKKLDGTLVQDRWINQGVTLKVPGNQPIYPVFYKTTLRWVLSNVPINLET
ncbi:WxL domain-containing protein [Vagococcus humatus]|uniref:WxL domain-containing protein n=1 Tax=Vagococcus humatus TaxID=1889241 RepID=A0A3R9YKG5_9ENTE|nr:WxL domain-containing protein [Vagococcus humatus]RST89800.1 WxL domain-containing protein [Vagococcus humatus]